MLSKCLPFYGFPLGFPVQEGIFVNESMGIGNTHDLFKVGNVLGHRILAADLKHL